MKDTLKQAISAHKSGNIQEAEKLYKLILTALPDHPDANHNLGVIAVSNNKIKYALALFQTALKSNPAIPQFWLSYASALLKLGNYEQAAEVMKKAQNKGFPKHIFDPLKQELHHKLKDRANTTKSLSDAQVSDNNLAKDFNLQRTIRQIKSKIKAKDYLSAEDLCHSILRKYPKKNSL